jgi:uncharacterized protein (TIGR00730 family)
MTASPNFRRICVFCGSSTGNDDAFREAAVALGRALAEREIELVYGGGKIGLMGIVADAVLAAGGKVIGVIPDKLQALEVGHDGLTELFVVESMHARKAMMAQLSDAFIAMPGGWGTLEEVFEVTTWTQLNYHKKPVCLFNVAGYYDGLLAFVRHAVESGFIREIHQDLLAAATTPDEILHRLSVAEIPKLPQWIRTL